MCRQKSSTSMTLQKACSHFLGAEPCRNYFHHLQLHLSNNNISNISHVTSTFQSTSERLLFFYCPNQIPPRAIFLVSISVNKIISKPNALFLFSSIPMLSFFFFFLNTTMYTRPLLHWTQMLSKVRLNRRKKDISVHAWLHSPSREGQVYRRK